MEVWPELNLVGHVNVLVQKLVDLFDNLVSICYLGVNERQPNEENQNSENHNWKPGENSSKNVTSVPLIEVILINLPYAQYNTD